MRFSLCLAVVLALAACDTHGPSALSPSLDSALAEAAPPPHTTGGVTVAGRGLEVQINVQAHEGTPDWGSVNVSDDTGRSFEGDVTCYYQEGNVAGISGVVTGGTYPPGMHFRLDVQDNGQGANSPPDRVRLRVKRAPQACSPLAVSFPGRALRGNLQVH